MALPTSANVGKEDAAPRHVTPMALLAKVIASGTDSDFARAAAKAPIKQSPAPGVKVEKVEGQIFTFDVGILNVGENR
jgi:hypothetical protein